MITREKFQSAVSTIATKALFLKEKAVYIWKHAPSYWNAVFEKKNEGYLAAAAYIPFIGWLLPLYLKEESDFCQESGKTGFILAIFFTGLVLGLFFINLFFIPRDWRVVRLIMVLLVYACYAVYFPLCGYGMYLSVHGKKLEIPFLSQYRNIIPL